MTTQLPDETVHLIAATGSLTHLINLWRGGHITTVVELVADLPDNQLRNHLLASVLVAAEQRNEAAA